VANFRAFFWKKKKNIFSFRKLPTFAGGSGAPFSEKSEKIEGRQPAMPHLSKINLLDAGATLHPTS
jgi:hypothetical protein